MSADRRGHVLYWLVLLGTVFVLEVQTIPSTAAAGAGGHRAKPRPHIVFVLADDLGSHDLGYHNDDVMQTPNLNKLAAESVRLDRYYVQPVCSPSRAALMTGRYPFRLGLQHYVLQKGHNYGVDLEEVVLPEMLKEIGYKTHAVGKWHLGFCSWQYTPTFRGFDSFYGFYGGGEDYLTHAAGGAYDFRRDSAPNCGRHCSEVPYGASGRYSTYLFTNESVRIVQQHDPNEPLFLYMAYQSVHAPMEIDEDHEKRYKNTYPARQTQKFGGMLTAMDDGIGAIKAALLAKNMWNDTLFIFSSDNGGPLKGNTDPRRKQIFYDVTGASNFPFRGGKHTLWEGGVRAEGFVHGTMVNTSVSSRRSGMMHITDWFPTLLHAAGYDLSVPKSHAFDGVSQWPMISQNLPSPRSEVVLNIDRIYNKVGPFYRGGHGNAAIVIGKWKLIAGDPGPVDIWSARHRNQSSVTTERVREHPVRPVYKQIGKLRHQLRLYNVIADERETRDLSRQYTKVTEALWKRLQHHISRERPPLYAFAGGMDGHASPHTRQRNHTWTPWLDFQHFARRPRYTLTESKLAAAAARKNSLDPEPQLAAPTLDTDREDHG